ncbi:methyltransferase [Microbacterium dextranolyticum]|uniref:Methyltransferase n=1 Tax=Microbacterium dextranolyticum TaxID=36806 RepID=A0A9W6HNN0_9MICO|nr:methyltransferase [Microbacterium dextranolyticum]MBM7462824.1 hypothetical protein [Microbacterium dextranolyticum]GLJ96071.1 hypothetical protein GCM10017591_21340 [Microbacterium dextranolyticum]
MSTVPSAVWVAYGSEGRVVGTIRRGDEGYTATVAGADASIGTYPSMDIAKNALHGHLTPGSEWPTFREH